MVSTLWTRPVISAIDVLRTNLFCSAGYMPVSAPWPSEGSAVASSQDCAGIYALELTWKLMKQRGSAPPVGGVFGPSKRHRHRGTVTLYGCCTQLAVLGSRFSDAA